MKHKNKFIFSFGVIACALLILFSVNVGGFSFNEKIKNPVSVTDVVSEMPDQQAKEPVYMSIFKLIVNCNPFKQKTSSENSSCKQFPKKSRLA